MQTDLTENPRGFGGKENPEPVENENGEIPATEEEEMNYDLLTVRARKIIFGEGMEKILKMLGTSESPGKAMGQVGSMIVKSLMDSSKQAGRDINGETAINAAYEIIGDLNELGKAKGVFTYDDAESEKKETDDAMLWGVKFYGDGMIASGEITPEMRAQAKEQVEQGIAEEQAPKKTKVAEGVNKAINQQAPGLVGDAMQGGV